MKSIVEEIDDAQLESLIHGTKEGDENAFRGIFELLSDRIYGYVYSRVRNKDSSLDITQDIFVKLWQAMPKFEYQGREAFLGYLFTIAKRELAHAYKETLKHREAKTEEPDSYEHEYEDYRTLLKNIETLSERYQEVLRLKYWSYLTFAEIGATLGMQETAARVLHHRALGKLKLVINEKYGGRV
tara:strand:+ start:1623 stop:2177 length:555 start_codon:yes stop_codon:yes gene_type:complete